MSAFIIGTPRQIHATCVALGGHKRDLAHPDECPSCHLPGEVVRMLENEDRRETTSARPHE